MLRIGFGIAVLGCLVVALCDVSACGRRGGRHNRGGCCPSNVVYCAPVYYSQPVCCDATPPPPPGTADTGPGSTDEPGTTNASTAPTPEEEKMWKWMVENGYEQKDYDLLWKNATPANRKASYDGLQKTIREANEKVEREEREKNKKKDNKKNPDNDNESQISTDVQTVQYVTTTAYQPVQYVTYANQVYIVPATTYPVVYQTSNGWVDNSGHYYGNYGR